MDDVLRRKSIKLDGMRYKQICKVGNWLEKAGLRIIWCCYLLGHIPKFKCAIPECADELILNMIKFIPELMCQHKVILYCGMHKVSRDSWELCFEKNSWQ